MTEGIRGFADTRLDRRLGSNRRPAGVGGRRGADSLGASVAASGAVPRGHARVDRSPPHENGLWDVRAAARFLRMSASWVYKRVEDGTLPVARLNGYSLRFEPAALREWAASHVAGRSPAARSRR
jgi:predicted DNA-binding transcriptional regulator AlpA